MKGSLVVLFAFVCLAHCAPTTTVDPGRTTRSDGHYDKHKEDLIKRAASLEKKAEAEIKKLTAEGESQKANQLKKEEAELKKLVAQLEKTSSDDHQALLKIEKEVEQAEQRINKEIEQDERRQTTADPGRTTRSDGHYDKHKEDLIKRAANLEKKAEAEIKKLTAEGETQKANVLKKEEAELKKLVAQLEKTSSDDHQALLKIEKEVELAESRINKEIEQDERRQTTADPGRTTRSDGHYDKHKEDLIKRAANLEKKAEAEIKKLTAAGETQKVNTLKKEEAELKKLVAQLEKTSSDDHQALLKIEKEVEQAEQRINKEIEQDERRQTTADPGRTTRSDGHYDKHKEDLVNRARTVDQRAEAEYEKLTAAGETEKAAELRKEEAELNELVGQLEMTSPDDHQALLKIEKKVEQAEQRIDALINQYERRTTQAPTTP